MASSNKTNRAPWIMVSVLGCLVVCLILLLIAGVVYFVFVPGAPAQVTQSPIANPVPISPTIPTASSSPTRAPNTPIDPKAATVQVQVSMDKGGFSYGSGSIVQADGLILTCFHVIGDNNTGQFYNKDRIATIGIVSLPNGVIVKRYRAVLDKWNTKLDVATLRINAEEDGTPLKLANNFPTVMWGDSNIINIDDKILVYGFPGIASGFLNATPGIISGFETEEGQRTWIKTSAQLNRGVSGGMAIDERGRLIGIPDLVKVSGAQGLQEQLSYLIPINRVITWINSPNATPSTQDSTPTVSPTKPPSSPTPIPEVTPPPGLYAIAIRPEATVMRMQGNIPIIGEKQEVFFTVTFLNTTGTTKNERWFVYIYQGPVSGGGKSIGETAKREFRQIPPGRSEHKTTNGWNSGQGRPCTDYWARVHTVLFDQSIPDIDIRAPFNQQTRQAFQVCP